MWFSFIESDSIVPMVEKQASVSKKGIPIIVFRKLTFLISSARSFV